MATRRIVTPVDAGKHTDPKTVVVPFRSSSWSSKLRNRLSKSKESEEVAPVQAVRTGQLSEAEEAAEAARQAAAEVRAAQGRVGIDMDMARYAP